MAGHAQLKFVMTECSKTQIRLTGLILSLVQIDKVQVCKRVVAKVAVVS